jgi:Mg2+ and Co2+ transporter CorA
MIESAVLDMISRIEPKIDDIRKSIHELDIKTSGTMIRQAASEKEIETLRDEVAELRSAYDKAMGAYKLAMVPGVLSLVYAICQFLAK